MEEILIHNTNIDDKSDDESLKSAVASIDDIEEIFDALSEGDDKQFTEGNMDFDYEDSKRGIFEDFVFHMFVGWRRRVVLASRRLRRGAWFDCRGAGRCSGRFLRSSSRCF